MSAITKEYAKSFLKQQEKLFDFPVADNVEEAMEFLEECDALVFDNLKDALAYLDDSGYDVEGINEKNVNFDELLELFKMPDGKYLIVEG